MSDQSGRSARSRRAIRLSAFIIGGALGCSSLALYATAGYGRGMLVMWLAGLGLLVAAFAGTSERLARVPVPGLGAAAGLVVAFAPLYLARLYRWPVQVGSDEVSIMSSAKSYASRDGVDLFGASDYLGHPAALIVLLGDVGNWLGGVELLHMRLIHGALGLAVIAASYALLRQLLPRRWAIFAACVLGLSHSLLMISRMAMRENTSVLLEVAALALLVRGLRHGHPLADLPGGAQDQQDWVFACEWRSS